MNGCDWSGWSPWNPPSTLDFTSVPTGPGAYVISASKPIPRSIGVDELGILDIGESKGLRQRLKDFVRCAAKYGDEGHMAGWRFAYFRFARHYPFESLRVRWIDAETKTAAYEIEGRAFLAYITTHSELPPLNYSFNWSPFKADG